ncbi:MAG: DUF1178 family protein [Desulfobacteraceae bacterium]|nr:DUF1178 family protein [Desulfobacteraceae bacterium]
MITYDLICKNGHNFEGWFETGSDFNSQLEAGLISCPLCGNTSISKLLSPVGYIKKTGQAASQVKTEADENIKLIEESLQKISSYFEKNFENVGSDFTKTALKIHYGVEEPKNIRGNATEEEKKILEKEGVTFLDIPILKKNEVQ